MSKNLMESLAATFDKVVRERDELRKACKLALDYLDGPATPEHVLSQKRHNAIKALEEALKPYVVAT